MLSEILYAFGHLERRNQCCFQEDCGSLSAANIHGGNPEFFVKQLTRFLTGFVASNHQNQVARWEVPTLRLLGTSHV